MGLLDQLAHGALGALSDEHAAGLAKAVLDHLQSQPGGLNGLVTAFEQQGLGNVVASWIGTGQNLPVNADQLRAVLGDERIAALAARAGIPPDQAAAALQQLLPTLIDHLTPNGQVPAPGSLASVGLALFRKLAQ